MASPFGDRQIPATPVSPVMNGVPVFIDHPAVATTGQVIVSGSQVVRQGTLLINEDSTNNARVGTSSPGKTLLPKKVGDVVTPIFFPGQGPLIAYSALSTVRISGWTY